MTLTATARVARAAAPAETTTATLQTGYCVTTLYILVALAAGLAAGYFLGRGRRGAPPAPAAAADVAAPAAPAESQRLAEELAQARAETARYRQLVLDIENNAPPPIMGPGAPDDLKLIVGVGPVLERMLHQLGVTTFRQIAYWSERDIDAIDAQLHEFPGRIRRDGWVTQARALHQSKYGEALPTRPAP
jgi:predicted flap endonuclease-1-like 5' DNA nuclease